MVSYEVAKTTDEVLVALLTLISFPPYLVLLEGSAAPAAGVRLWVSVNAE